MDTVGLIAGIVALFLVLLDAFQTIILPRRPVGRFRVTRLFFGLTWGPWRRATGLLRNKAAREQSYSIYGPLSLLMLFAVWAGLLVVSFGLIIFGLHTPYKDPMLHGAPIGRLGSAMYVSGTTLFTLGLGDLVPATHAARLLTVLEAGVGLGFVALVIGYVPVLYTAFSQRETLVALLDARAGSPPTAGELLARHSYPGGEAELTRLLDEWERWCAAILETHISYPILCYYRSQHDNQSWMSSLVAVLDTCALLITMHEGVMTRQAQLTFAIGRHALVDLVHVFHLEALEKRLRDVPSLRLDDDEFGLLCDRLKGTSLSPCLDFEARERLNAVRRLYEPHACALAEMLRLGLPRWAPAVDPNRRSDAWTVVEGYRSPAALIGRVTGHVSGESTASHLEEHDKDRG